MKNNQQIPIQTPQSHKHHVFRNTLIFIAVMLLIFVVGFHVILPLLGIAIVMTAGIWGFILLTFIFFGLAGFLVFLLPGILIVLVGLFVLAWVILAFILFPLLFPLILPVFIIFLIIALLRKKKSP